MAQELLEAYGGVYPQGDGWRYDDTAHSYPVSVKLPAQEYKPHDKSVYTSQASRVPPSEFQLQCVDEVQEPPPSPSSGISRLYIDSTVFQDADAHALKVSEVKYRTLRELLWNLIYAREISNDLEKIRIIFRWLCENDPEFLHFHDLPANFSTELTHSTAFQVLCQHAKIQCHLIRGFVKLSSKRPGSPVTGNDRKHTWNAVYIDGLWKFVDCCWASRAESGTTNFPGETRKKFDEFYFMPASEHFIMTHFPDDSAWQLLDPIWTKEEFEKHVYCSSFFTQFALQLLSHKDGVIRTKSDVTVCIGCPESKVATMAFMFSLEFDHDGDMMRSHKLNRLVQYHRTLNGYGMIERLGNITFFTIRPPEEGSYRFIIYAKDSETMDKEDKFRSVCTYEIEVEEALKLSKFPPCPRDKWGYSDSMNKFGVIPKQKGAVIKTTAGWIDIRFKLLSKFDESDFQIKVKTVGKFATDLEECVIHRLVEDEVIFTMTFPKPGEYGLEIYAKENEGSDEKLKHLVQYLVIAKNASEASEMLPGVPPGFLGTKAKFAKLGISTVSHPDPIIKSVNCILEVVLGSKDPVNYSTNLIYISNNKYQELSENVLRQGQQGQGNEVTFVLRLPKIGWYRFEIYAVSRADPIQKLPNVYNYLINCNASAESSMVAFPKQFAMWNGGCHLLEPLDDIKPGKNHFKVCIPEAEDVAVIIDGDWKHLHAEGNLWEGDVDFEGSPGRETTVKLSAQFPSKKAFSTLLQYTLNTH